MPFHIIGNFLITFEGINVLIIVASSYIGMQIFGIYDHLWVQHMGAGNLAFMNMGVMLSAYDMFNTY